MSNDRRPKAFPTGPDELLGLTEGGKVLLAILIAVVVLAVLVWTAVRVS